MSEDLLFQAAVDREVKRLEQEFAAWDLKRRLKDEKYVAGILRAWGFEVGEA